MTIDTMTRELSESEQWLVDAAREGAPCKLGGETVDARVIAAILTGEAQQWGLAGAGVVELENARVVGELHGFDGRELPSVILKSCTFEKEVKFDGATFLGEARFEHSEFWDHARFAKTTFVGESHFEETTFGDAEFYMATFLGDAAFTRATFVSPRATKPDAVCAGFRRARFAGDAYFQGVRFHRDADFERVKVEGNARFGEVGEEELAEDDAQAAATIFTGKAMFLHACFSGLASFKRATFTGGADFYQATFAGDADFYKATFAGDSEARFERAAFNGNAEFGGAEFRGRAGFPNATFAGDAEFGRTDFASGSIFAKDADFYEAAIASNADFSGATFGGSAGFERVTCAGDANFSAATFHERACFRRARCAAGLSFDGASFGDAGVLEAAELSTQLVNVRFAQSPRWLSLKEAEVATIEDNPAVWPDERYLTGCAYGRIHANVGNGESPDFPMWSTQRWLSPDHRVNRRHHRPSLDKMDVTERIEWLKGEPNGYDPFRYDQMIAAYRLAGRDTEATRVALAKQRERRATLKLPGRAWGLTQDWLVGYGYRLWLPIVWIAVLIAVGSLAFRFGPIPTGKEPPPEFNPFFYATDLVFPVVNIGQRSNFQFDGWRSGLAFILMVAGWILAAAVVAGVQRLLAQREK